ncbi:hypothetical protein AMTRI_Chr01g128760 [Amborella trichopoda]
MKGLKKFVVLSLVSVAIVMCHSGLPDDSGREGQEALFYYLAEAAEPLFKPLLLWVNGGPGVSSLGYGAMEELGPFRLNSDGTTLCSNIHAWNKEIWEFLSFSTYDVCSGDVLFLESPAGVGFSYSNTTYDYDHNGGESSTSDAYTFLINWFDRFPEYKNKDFYISGESYRGYYAPQMAYQVLMHNQLTIETIINLKGIATFDAINKYCQSSPNSTENQQQCDVGLNVLQKVYDDIYTYNIYGPNCNFNGFTEPQFDPPCTDLYVENYLNLPEDQKAFHAKITRLPYPWSIHMFFRDWSDRPTTVLPLIQDVMAHGIRVNKFELLNLRLQKIYSKIYVGVYSVIYRDGLTFATVRGAGHLVPSYQPERSPPPALQ